MSDRLPPLTALRAFEAAARHLSFAQAAAELNVTPAALSFQIKSLEQHLGEPVFHRLNRAVELTEAGRALAPGVSDGFAAISAAWRNAQRSINNNVLTVTAGPAFTSKWLAPRLFEFAERHPEIELRFSASLRLMDFERDEVDVAIRFGLGKDEGVYSEPLVREWMTPMMTPELADTYDTPEKLSHAPLIHDDSLAFLKDTSNWSGWFKAAGVTDATGAGVRFSQADHALDAALSGVGVVLGRVSLATRALERGQLVAPFRLGLVPPAHFRFVCPLGTEKRPHVAAFRSWIKDEIQSSKAFEGARDLVPVQI
ncbi:transcriptional regulator GcvA [Octadecabacter sp. 1_MG-2023]|uniref:transcriptional regulator GcvA n=1 Tax=unclassified Octadecabacter TaxID=196158 RepID=UPI001C08F08F|nr:MULTISPECIES: transcriptional regulator GcvA [unclassified Octadecabacter]MBU2994139.1 transcriptional regulator GcvA [Octadecabacter sp. B2R22]MDO6734572.1 transcriptional regulator GcvA [Octadecabacter sp. 1_MG-2023]